MAINNSTKFSPVYTTPSYLAKQLAGDASKLQEGKLYFATGEASGMIGQGLYVYTADNNETNDGKGTISLFGSGTIASATTPGLLDPSTFTYIANLKNGTVNAPNASHANTAGTADIAKQVDSSLYIKVNGTSFKTYDASAAITFDISAGSNVSLSTSENTLTIAATDTKYSNGDGISLSGTTFSHADTTNTTANASYGPTADASQTAKNTITIKVPEIKVDKFGHVSDVSVKTFKILDTDTNTWRAVKVNGTEKIGSTSSTALDLSAGANIAINYTNSKVVIDASGVPTKNEMNTAISGAVSSLFKYQGDVSATPTSSVVGYAYRASSKFTLSSTNSITNSAETVEVGDIILCTNASGPKFTVIQNNITNAVTFDPSNNASGEIAVFGSNGQIKTTGTSISTITNAISEVSGAAGAAAGTVKDTSGTGKSYLLGHSNQGSTAGATTNASVYMQNGKLYSNNSEVALVSNIPSTLPNANALNIKAGNVTLASYTGSAVKNITLSTGNNITFDASTDGTLKISSTDSKVTSAANHYVPAVKDTSTLTLNASSGTAASWGSTDMVTGITLKRDEKGHIVDASISSIQMPSNPNTDTKVTTSSSTAKLFIIGKTDASKATASAANYNANVYINTSNQIVAASGAVASNNTALVTGGTVYTYVENKVAGIDTAVYWEVLS